jgi:hypothetical protein
MESLPHTKSNPGRNHPVTGKWRYY